MYVKYGKIKLYIAYWIEQGYCIFVAKIIMTYRYGCIIFKQNCFIKILKITVECYDRKNRIEQTELTSS